MWSMANPALTEHIFLSPAPIQSEYDFSSDEGQNMFIKANEKFQEASNSVGSYMGMYGLSSMVFALILVFFTSKMRVNRKLIHMFSLISGGIGFLLMYFIPISNILLLSFVLIGISWGSILSMPYAMLSSSVDENKMGIMMGIFNMFIVLPQISAALGCINFLSNLFGSSAIFSMVVAGICLIIAGLCNLLINEKKAIY